MAPDVLVRAGEVELNVRRSPAEPRPGMPTVVCVHGLVIDDMSSFYFTLAGALAEVADVVCYDLRGHGGSPVPRSGYTVADHVADLFALVDALAIDGPVHLVGFSYGASVVLTAALRRPERVASLVVLDGEYPVDGWGHELAVTLDLVSAQLGVDSVMARLAITNRRKAERLCRRIGTLVHDTTLRQDVVGELALSDDDLRAVRQPALVAYGSQSDLLPRGHRLASLLPGVEYRELAGAGHRVIAERAAELQALTTAWLRRHGQGPAPLTGTATRAGAATKAGADGDAADAGAGAGGTGGALRAGAS
jgi:pimeloyl-ACP methyl ester carboxylesterase